MTLTRDFAEVPEGVPPSQHHPNCDLYVLRTYARLSIDDGDSWFVVTLAEGREIAASRQTLVTTIDLTEDQFEALPEYKGP